ncbi:FMN-binding protein [Acetobacterium paludosum]|uniref:Ion-translocating oxidoreductase complex subunit G n=1 Tax=Acetobacterium paludosum TaxID=52693 RepID=A0A923HSX4_9FIRM|nr:FMN-binding protein [Acetobacterium paludosum]MBC3888074.1 FMN-binding protein [Acetobacterium paludosum]
MSTEHTTKEYSIFQIAINLMIACFVAGLIIGVTNFVTSPIAIKNAADKEMKTMQALVPDADTFTPIEGKTDWYAATKGGEKIAYVVPGETKGYGGAITMLVAVKTTGEVINFSILKANETPGLGDNAGKEPFKSQFAGKTSENLVVTKDPSNKENIQAMTGATISSKAVTKGVKEAVDEVVAFAGGNK